MNDLSSSLAYVRDAMAALPNALSEALAAPLPRLDAAPACVVTTGIGGSEGPARWLAELLATRGVSAHFRPLSSFVDETPRACDLLISFSQGLSPNARLVLGPSERFRTRWLVTSLGAGDERLAPFSERGFVPIVIPPRRESGTLVRLLGPTVATLTSLRLAAQLTGDAELTARIPQASSAYLTRSTPKALAGALAIVTVGVDAAAAHGHRWKLLEALREGDPPVWDILQFAHGPLQSFYGRPLTLLVLERGAGSPLLPRLESIVDQNHHRIVHIPSAHDSELAFFEHAAALDGAILATLEHSPRDMFDWPARGADGPLYGFGGTR
jgi:hypothetical protein